MDIEALIDRIPGVARCAIVPYRTRCSASARACSCSRRRRAAPDAEAITRELDRAGVAKFKWPERQADRGDAAHPDAESDARPPARAPEA